LSPKGQRRRVRETERYWTLEIRRNAPLTVERKINGNSNTIAQAAKSTKKSRCG